MNTLYNFATGPLAWLAFVVCIGGIIWRLWSYALLARMRDGSALAYIRPKYSLISFFRWTVPYATCGWRANPRLTLASFILHLGLFVSILFYSGHNVMWDYNFGFSLPSLPDLVVSILVFAAILACIFLGVRRLYISAASHVVARRADWVGLVLVTATLVSGFASAPGVGDQGIMTLLHVLCGEALLVCLPFTRLSHAFLIPFTRAYMGSESIGVRRTCDW